MSEEVKAFEKPLELVLEATLEVLSPLIKTVTSEFTFKDLYYWSIEEAESASSYFRKILITLLDVIEDSIVSEDCMGIITLQSLGTDRTLFRIPPRSEWYIAIEHRTLPQLQYQGHVSKNEFNLFWDESYFTHLLERLFAEFQRLGFVDSKVEKPAATAKAQKDTGELPSYLFDNMQFHPRIIRASKSLFNSGHYAEAIFAAFKAINNFTKKKSGLSLDGKDLMAKAFNEDKPIIKLNKLLTRSEQDEQEGFRFLFMGAMVGIRNPKAHDDIRQTDPYRTLEYLAFASLLMRRVTEGKLEAENK